MNNRSQRFAVKKVLWMMGIFTSILGGFPETARTDSPFYEFEVIARTGDGQLTAIDPEVSINESGTVVFAAHDGQDPLRPLRIWMADASTAYVPISPFRNGYDYDKPQINNVGTVVYRVQARVLPNYYFSIRTWSPDAPGLGETTVFTAEPGDEVSWPTISNVYFLVDGYPTIAYYESFGSTPGKKSALSVAGELTDLEQFAAGSFYPVVAMAVSGGKVVWKDNDGVQLYDRVNGFDTIAPTQFGPPGLAVALFASDGSHPALGSRPGVSQDGSVIAFYGNLTETGAEQLKSSPGPGVFIATKLPLPLGDQLGKLPGRAWNIVRVTGYTYTDENDVEQHFAELGWYKDNGARPAAFDPDGYSWDSRIGVCSRGGSMDERLLTLAFQATPLNWAVTAHAPNFITMNKGLWTMRLIVAGDQTDDRMVKYNFPPHEGRRKLRSTLARPVVQIGDTIAGQAVSSIDVYDPLANRISSEPGDHCLAFRVTTPAGDMVIKANYAASELADAVLSQAVWPWGQKIYELPNVTFQNKACALTALTIGVNLLGKNTNPYKNFLDLKTAGYLDGANINWIKGTPLVSQNFLEFSFSADNWPYNDTARDSVKAFDYLDRKVDMHLPVIVGLDFDASLRCTESPRCPGHFVVVTGKTKNPDEYIIQDGGYVYNQTLSGSPYNNDFQVRGTLVPKLGGGGAIRQRLPGGLRPASAIDGTYEWLSLSVAGSPHLRLTDPNGTMTGAFSGVDYQDIPGSFHFVDDYVDLQTGMRGTDRAEFVYVSAPALGVYQLNVSGAGGSHYKVELAAGTRDGDIVDFGTIEGEIPTGGAIAFPWHLTNRVFQISQAGFDKTACLLVNCLEGRGHYYILYRGTEVNDISHPVDIEMGTSGPGQLIDRNPPPGNAFYRVEEVRVYQSRDSDGDGIDDVYELQHPAFLNALNPADAGEDYDHDGISNLDEYRQGSDPDVTADAINIVEGNARLTTALLFIGLANPSFETNVVAFATADGTAHVESDDYVPTNGTVVFLPGETRKALTLLVRGDIKVESNEVFYLNLSLVSGSPGAALVVTQVVCTILNDDAPPGTIVGLVSLEATASTALTAVSPCESNCGVSEADRQTLLWTNSLATSNDHARADARSIGSGVYASASADASPGRLAIRSWVDAQFPQGNATYSFQATNLARYSVVMRPVTTAVPLGGNCTLKVRFHIMGVFGWLLDHIQRTASNLSGGDLSAQCTFQVNGQVLGSRQYQDRQLLDGNTNLSRFPDTNGETMEILIPVKNGQTFTNRVTLQASLSAQDLMRTGTGGTGSFFGVAGFWPGAYWDGAVALYDAQNQEIPDFTIESPTLIDWRQSLKPPDAPPVDSYKPPIPVSLVIEPAVVVITNLAQKAPLTVTGTYSNRTTADLTAPAAWTIYKSYDGAIATVDRNGVVTGRRQGQTVVRAENQGAVKSVLVTVSTSGPPRTVTGQVLHRNGQPAGGATVTVVESLQATTTDANGFFQVVDVPSAATQTITVMAVWQTNVLRGFRQSATSPTVSAAGTGLLNVGTIILNTHFDLRAARMFSKDIEDDFNPPIPDGLPSGWELLFGYDPTLSKTDKNTYDAAADPDEDGLTNLQEYISGTDPFSYDSDGDLWDDATEVATGSDPCLSNIIPPRFSIASPPVTTFLTRNPPGSTTAPLPSQRFILGVPPVSSFQVAVPAGDLASPQPQEQLVLARPPVTTFGTGVPGGITNGPGNQFIVARPPVTVSTNAP